MSFPFLVLAGISCLIMAGSIQTDVNTNTIPLFLWVIYFLSGAFFLWGIIRAIRIIRY